MGIFYVNQAYQSYKDNKKVYYCVYTLVGQVAPCINQPPSPLRGFEELRIQTKWGKNL